MRTSDRTWTADPTPRRRRSLPLLAVTVAVLLLPLGLLAATGPPPAAPASHGPFPVGFFNTTIPQAGPFGASAPATVFYPSMTGGDSAPSNTSRAPYGTISFAPGYGASRIEYWEMLHTIAREGYVALGVDYNPGPLPNTGDIADRVRFSLDWLEAENASAVSILYGMIDAGRFVSSGHSMGGGISVLAAERHARFDFLLPLSPFITLPLFIPPNLPQDAVTNVFLPTQVVVGGADATSPPALHADVLYANGNCPKSEYIITGADHTFSNPAHRQLLQKYVVSWLHYYVEREAAQFDAVFGAGAQADEAAGLISYSYCLDVASVEVTPKETAVLVGGTAPFVATVRDRIGTPWNAPVAWTTAGGIGTVDAFGTFTATAAGVGNVTAASAGLSDMALVATGPAYAPWIRSAVLSGVAWSDVTIEWWKAAADGIPGGPQTYRVLRAWGDPAGAYEELAAIPANASPSYSYTCASCGHIPGNTTREFFLVQSEDASGNLTDSNLAARYAKTLSVGPNLVSVPLEQADGAVAVVLQTLGTNVRVARTYRAGAADPWQAWSPGRGGDLTVLPLDDGVWIDLPVPGQYTVAGLVPVTSSVSLFAGWNLVSYASLTEETSAASLVGLPILRVEAFDAVPEYYLREVAAAEPLLWGEAYWVWASAPATWDQG